MCRSLDARRRERTGVVVVVVVMVAGMAIVMDSG